MTSLPIRSEHRNKVSSIETLLLEKFGDIDFGKPNKDVKRKLFVDEEHVQRRDEHPERGAKKSKCSEFGEGTTTADDAIGCEAGVGEEGHHYPARINFGEDNHLRPIADYCGKCTAPLSASRDERGERSIHDAGVKYRRYCELITTRQ